MSSSRTRHQEEALSYLNKLEQYGYTATQLENWKGGFDIYQYNALKYLSNKGYTSSQAIAEISG